MAKLNKKLDLGDKVGNTTEKVGETTEAAGEGAQAAGGAVGATGATLGAVGASSNLGGSDDTITTNDLGLDDDGPAGAGIAFVDGDEGFTGVVAGGGVGGDSQAQAGMLIVGEGEGDGEPVGGAAVGAWSVTDGGERALFGGGAVNSDDGLGGFASGATENSITMVEGELGDGGLETNALQMTTQDATALGTEVHGGGVGSYVAGEGGVIEPLELDDSGEAGVELDTETLDVG